MPQKANDEELALLLTRTRFLEAALDFTHSADEEDLRWLDEALNNIGDQRIAAHMLGWAIRYPKGTNGKDDPASWMESQFIEAARKVHNLAGTVNATPLEALLYRLLNAYVQNGRISSEEVAKHTGQFNADVDASREMAKSLLRYYPDLKSEARA